LLTSHDVHVAEISGELVRDDVDPWLLAEPYWRDRTGWHWLLGILSGVVSLGIAALLAYGGLSLGLGMLCAYVVRDF